MESHGLNVLIGKGLTALELDLDGILGGGLQFFIYDTIKIFVLLSVLIFMGFTSAGLPVGVTFSFLISSPMVDLGSLVLLMSIFGAKIAVAYVLLGLVIAVIGGTFLEKTGMERYVEDFVKKAVNAETETAELTRHDRIVFSKEQVLATIKKVAPYIFVGVRIGAFIHNVIPQVWIEEVLVMRFRKHLRLNQNRQIF